jgi:predicted AlkP superfamily pyrophosphatase or phosphodiesterase
MIYDYPPVKHMKLIISLLFSFTCLLCNYCQADDLPTTQPTTHPTTRPIPAITRVLIISIDGCRPDLLLRANTPVIHSLLPIASFTFWARTTAESVTLPSHTSMLTGVTPVKHGIQWNMEMPLYAPVYPAYPTLFQLAKQNGYTTAMAAGKGKFDALAVPGSIDWDFIPTKEKIEDPTVTDQAIQIIHEHQPQVMFIHLPSVDNIGHAVGWSSAIQLMAISRADACIGRILAELDDQHLRDSTFILITADHGGAGRTHGPDDPRSRHIPWIALGPGIRKDLDLTVYDQLTIDTEDTFATACYLLGIHLHKPIDGKPITQIIQRTELLVSK